MFYRVLAIIWKGLLSLSLLFSPLLMMAQNGPGGIGKTNGKSDLALWLRADQALRTSGSGENASVKKWRDISGNDFLLAQSEEQHQPELAPNGINGKPAVKFNGSKGEFLTGNDFKGLHGVNNYTVFVLSHSAPIGGQALLSGVRSTDGKKGKPGLYIAKPKKSIHPNQKGKSNYRFTHRCPFRLSQKSGKNVYTTLDKAKNSGPNVLSFVKNRDSHKQTIRVNSKNVEQKSVSKQANLPFSSPLDLTIGALADWINAMNLHGKVAEIIIYKKALNEVELNTVEKYLEKRYGINHSESKKSENIPDGVQGLKGIGEEGSHSINQVKTGYLEVKGDNFVDENNSLFMGHKPLNNPNRFINLFDFLEISRHAWWFDLKQSSPEKQGSLSLTFNFKDVKPGNANEYRLIYKTRKKGNEEVIPIKPSVNGKKLTFKLQGKVLKQILPQNKGWLLLGSRKPVTAKLPKKLSPGYIKPGMVSKASATPE